MTKDNVLKPTFEIASNPQVDLRKNEWAIPLAFSLLKTSTPNGALRVLLTEAEEEEEDGS